jgi:hypothetical protein
MARQARFIVNDQDTHRFARDGPAEHEKIGGQNEMAKVMALLLSLLD